MKDRLDSMVDGERNTTIQSCVSRLALSGIDYDSIYSLIYNYEPRTSKMSNWEKFIYKCLDTYETSAHFNRYEVQNYKVGEVVYDNQNKRFRDDKNGNWLVYTARNEKVDLLGLLETNDLYKYLYQKIGDLNLSFKVKNFLELVISKDSREKIYVEKYKRVIDKGAVFKPLEWRGIYFNIFKFRTKFKELETSKLSEDFSDSFKIFDEDSDVIDKYTVNQNKVLNCLKDLIWYKYSYNEDTKYERLHYLTPKKLLYKIVDGSYFKLNSPAN